MTPGTKSVVGHQCGQMGMYLTRYVHYEEDSRRMNSFVGLTEQQNIKTNIYPTPGEPYYFSNEGWDIFFLKINGADWNERIKGMHLFEVAHTILFPGGRSQRLARGATAASQHSVGLVVKVFPKRALILLSKLLFKEKGFVWSD
jgi:hypothetical protein